MNVNQKIRITPGLVLSLLIIMIPGTAWLIGFDFGDRNAVELTGLALAKIGAFAGMSMFGWSLILSGRYKVIDSWFRGLDKVYIAHRFFGTASVALLLVHPIGLTLARVPSQGSGALGLWTTFGSTPIVLGMISLYSLLALVLWSIFARVKHETFVAIHRWLGLAFIAGALHAFMAGSIIASNPFIYWYMLILAIIATLTYIHYSLLADILHPHYKYKITSVSMLPGDVLDIRLQPMHRIVRFAPGQFFYVAFEPLGALEYHPFSVASSKHESSLRFMVKQLGDHTKEMTRLKKGDIARVKGPYGGFTFDDRKHPKQLWIAGGIGITPFMSKAHSLRFTKHTNHIVLFHCVREADQAIGHEELSLIKQRHASFDYRFLCEKDFGIIGLKDIVQQLGSLDDYAIYLCGAPPMLRAYRKQAEELGLSDQLYFEEFNY